jgi:hypothetical protein
LGGMKPPGSWASVYGFAVIALLIVLVACFNFMNLATARATLRAKEVAVRKVGGANRRHLIAQFLGEAVLMALGALIIALFMVEALAPLYARSLDRPLALHYVTDWKLMLLILGSAVATGVLGGFYPALVLSGFRPATALKMSTTTQSGSGWIRTALVVFQFTVSISGSSASRCSPRPGAPRRSASARFAARGPGTSCNCCCARCRGQCSLRTSSRGPWRTCICGTGSMAMQTGSR